MATFDAVSVATRMTAGIDCIDPGFPRDLAAVAPLLMPVAVMLVAGLATTDIEQALGAMTGRTPRALRPRRLRGCLVAHRGCAAVFLDDDDEARRRFAAAHEIAHFTGHYLARRELAAARLGSSVFAVLDGEREPTAAERFGGILSGCPLGVFVDVMERQSGAPLSRLAESMEYEADEAAFLALAPVGIVIARAIDVAGTVDRRAVIDVLTTQFGLAAPDAARHAPRVLSGWARCRPSIVDQMRAAASESPARRQT